MNLMQNNYFGNIVSDDIQDIINEFNLKEQLNLTKDADIDKLIKFVYEKGYSDGRVTYKQDLMSLLKHQLCN